MTGDKVEKDTMAFGHLTDLQMAGKVRMLMRSDLDHEAVCVGARDRIMYLSQQIESLRTNLAKALEIGATDEMIDEACDRVKNLYRVDAMNIIEIALKHLLTEVEK